MRRPLVPLLVLELAGCGGSAPPPRMQPAPPPATSARPTPRAAQPAAAPVDASATSTPEPALPPALAFLSGLMPLSSTGVDQFRERHPTYDGRGVLIGILDSGIDPGVAGLIRASTGAPKLVDLRDFSGEGQVALTPVTPAANGTVSVGGRILRGAGRISRLTAGTTWYAGVLRELPLGKIPAADLNGDGTNTDAFPVVVVRATDGWVAFLDSNLDGSFEDETPLHDYRQGRETIALGSKPVTLAANFGEANGAPSLDFVFDNSAHGTHVAGIAAGHDLFNVAGFDGVAPGAQLLGLKIANNARGGISVTGGIERALVYAARFAEQRNLPLVLNLSWGVGNEQEGRAVIDSIVDAFLASHPSVLFAISAGNDGPGLSSMGFPGSADLALTVGAMYPGALFRTPQGVPGARDVVGYYSARGAAVDKPDLVAPGLAFSSVPAWNTGGELKEGTSMAAPHAAGLAACLLSAMVQEGRRVSAAEVIQALRASATPYRGLSVLDQGSGLPHLEAAYRWLEAGHQGSAYVVRTAAGGSAIFKRTGFAGPGDTLEVFRVRHVAGLRAAQFLLRSDVPWIGAPATVTAGGRETAIPVVYSLSRLVGPGAHIGTVTAWNPTDTLAGPLFTLATTVVNASDLESKPLDDERRIIGPGQVQRYFLRAERPGFTLRATVTLPDSTVQSGTVRLYEPNGQPFRDLGEAPVGRGDGGTVRWLVRGEDLVPGVYELDVIASPLALVTASVRAELSPVALAPLRAGLEVTNPGPAGVTGRVTGLLVGAERRFDIAADGASAESLTVRVPDWADRAAIEVEMPPAQWQELTDFGVTEFDSTGQQVHQAPLDYALGRSDFQVPAALAGRPLVVELFPGFARGTGRHPWRATVRVRFLLRESLPVGEAQDVSVVAGGRTALPMPSPPPLALPEEFHPLIEARVRATGGGIEAVRRLVSGRP